MTQLDLFAEDSQQNTPGAVSADAQWTPAACSAAALEKVDTAKLERLTEQEFLLFKDGAIGDDVVHRLQLMGLKVDCLSIRPRVSELKARGILVPTGTRRINRKGNTCAVLKHRDFL